MKTKRDNPIPDCKRNRYWCPDKFSGLSREKRINILMPKSLTRISEATTSVSNNFNGTGWDWLAEEQPCREQPGGPGGQPADRGSAVCPCSDEHQLHPRLHCQQLFPSAQHWWGHTWNTAFSLGSPVWMTKWRPQHRLIRWWRAGAQGMSGEPQGAGLVSREKRRWSWGLSNIIPSLSVGWFQRRCYKTPLGGAQWQYQKGKSYKKGNSSWKYRKKCSQKGWWSHGKGPKTVRNLYCWWLSRLSWTLPWATCCSCEPRVGLETSRGSFWLNQFVVTHPHSWRGIWKEAE